jgi:pimeloyl-ACP methyl ester carboxylesterase
MLSSKDSEKHRRICEAAAVRGRLAMRFDFAGRGESEGPPRLLTVTREIEDLRAAVLSIQARGIDRIALVGSSLGGTVALLTAAGMPSIEKLVTIAAPARVPLAPRQAWGGRRKGPGLVEVAPDVWISEEFFSDAACHDPIHAAKCIETPWRIIHGARDEVVPVGDARSLDAANPEAELLVHSEADHRFASEELLDWLVERVGEFLAP